MRCSAADRVEPIVRVVLCVRACSRARLRDRPRLSRTIGWGYLGCRRQLHRSSARSVARAISIRLTCGVDDAPPVAAPIVLFVPGAFVGATATAPLEWLAGTDSKMGFKWNRVLSTNADVSLILGDLRNTSTKPKLKCFLKPNRTSDVSMRLHDVVESVHCRMPAHKRCLDQIRF